MCVVIIKQRIAFLSKTDHPRMVTSGHVTTMVVAPFQPPFPKTTHYMQTSLVYVLWNRSYGWLGCGKIEVIMILGKFSFTNTGRSVNIWNNLPNSVVYVDFFDLFKV